MIFKTEFELTNLTTKRLLSYYKVIRKKHEKLDNAYRCECCGEYEWDVRDGDFTKEKEHLLKLKNYRKTIKNLLSNRENIN